MAKGSQIAFQDFHVAVGQAAMNLSSAPLKCALISSPITDFASTDADPRFGAGGGTNLATNEVSGTGYTAGGAACATPSISAAAGIIKYDAENAAIWAQNGAGPANIKTAVFYVDDASKRVSTVMDLTNDNGVTPISLQDGDVEVQINANGLYRYSII